MRLVGCKVSGLPKKSVVAESLVRAGEEELYCVFVAGDEYSEGEASPLPLLFALDALVSVSSSCGVVCVDVARHRS